MNSVEFIEAIRVSVIDTNLALYKNMYENNDIASVTDPYWKEALEFYRRLTTEQRHIFFKIIRQIEVDTVSNLLAILDGVAWIGHTDKIELTVAGNEEKLNGSLQDILLEMEERQ